MFNAMCIITLVSKEIEAITKIPVFTKFEGAEFKFDIRFYSSPLVFRYALCSFCAYTEHKGVYEFRVNSNIVRLMNFFIVIMH